MRSWQLAVSWLGSRHFPGYSTERSELKSASAPLISRRGCSMYLSNWQRYPYQFRIIGNSACTRKIRETEANDRQKIKKSIVRPRCDSNAQSLVPKTNALTIRPRGQTIKFPLIKNLFYTISTICFAYERKKTASIRLVLFLATYIRTDTYIILTR